MPSNFMNDFSHRTFVEPDPNANDIVIDDISEPIAFRFGIVGVGQGGGNIADMFYETGYRRVLLINTAETDLNSIKSPVAKLALDRRGAGKEPSFGRETAIRNTSKIRTKMANVFQEKVEKIIVCLGLGGGTGSGAGPVVVEIARDMVREWGGDPEKDVVVIMTLPAPKNEGPRPCYNALKAYSQIDKLGVPRIVIDNAKISKVIKTELIDYWGTINRWVVRTFHRFNNYAAEQSQIGNFDGTDLNHILSRGRILFSAFAVQELTNRYSVGEAMSKHLLQSLFADSDISTADTGACIMLLNKDKVQGKSMDDISNAFEELNSIMKPGSTLHQGTYVEQVEPASDGRDPEALFCYVMLGGLDHPVRSLENVFAKAKNFNPEYGTLSAFLDS